MRILKITRFGLCVASLSLAQAAPSAEKPQGGNVRFNADMLDKNIDPCTDFYAYACGKWKAQNPIPADRSEWGRFDELEERGEAIIRNILEKSAPGAPGRSVVEQKIGDYYQSCMDESAIESAGTRPLQDEFKAIDALQSKQDLAEKVTHLHREGVGALFSFSSDQDFKDATQVIAEADQGGMSLPDRDYYLKDDPKSVELRKQYVEHVQRLFELIGDSAQKAREEDKDVMDIETNLAKGALDRVSRSDPNKGYHHTRERDLAALSTDFGWDVYLRGIGDPATPVVNV